MNKVCQIYQYDETLNSYARDLLRFCWFQYKFRSLAWKISEGLKQKAAFSRIGDMENFLKILFSRMLNYFEPFRILMRKICVLPFWCDDNHVVFFK